MEKNVPSEWNKYRQGAFYPGFLIIDGEKKRENFKSNFDDQKVQSLVSTATTRNLCTTQNL